LGNKNTRYSKKDGNPAENAKIYVIVTDITIDVKISRKKAVQMLSPHLVHREQAARFKMTVTEDKLN